MAKTNQDDLSQNIDKPQSQNNKSKAKSVEQVRKEILQKVETSHVEALKILIERADKQDWRKSWSNEGVMQHNENTGKPYKGSNQMVLTARIISENKPDSRWMTYKQAEERNLTVEKGAKSSLVSFWAKNIVVDKKDEQGNFVLNDKGERVKELKPIKPVLKYYHVFNGTDIKGLPPYTPPSYTPEELSEQQKVAFARADILINEWVKEKGLVVRELPQTKAFFSPSLDRESGLLMLPMREQFDDLASFYATAFHELGHSTLLDDIRTKDELNQSTSMQFGSARYAREELIAELTSLYLCQEIGIDSSKSDLNKQSLAYIKSWAEQGLLTDYDLGVAIKDATAATKALIKHSPELELEKVLEIRAQIQEEAKLDAINEAAPTAEVAAANINAFFDIVDDMSIVRPTLKSEDDESENIAEDTTNEVESAPIESDVSIESNTEDNLDNGNVAPKEDVVFGSMAEQFIAKHNTLPIDFTNHDINAALGATADEPVALLGYNTMPNDKPRGSNESYPLFGIVFKDGSALAQVNLPKKQYLLQPVDTTAFDLNSMVLGEKANTLFELENIRTQAIESAEKLLDDTLSSPKDNAFWLDKENTTPLYEAAGLKENIASDLATLNFGKATTSSILKMAKKFRREYSEQLDTHISRANREHYYAENYKNYSLDFTNPMVRELMTDKYRNEDGSFKADVLREVIATQTNDIISTMENRIPVEERIANAENKILVMPNKDSFLFVRVMDGAANIMSLDYTDREGEKTHRNVAIIGVVRDEMGNSEKDKLSVLDLDVGEHRSLFMNKINNLVHINGVYTTPEKWLTHIQKVNNNDLSTVVAAEAASLLITDAIERLNNTPEYVNLAEYTFDHLLKQGLKNYEFDGTPFVVNNSVLNNVKGNAYGRGSARLLIEPIDHIISDFLKDTNQTNLLSKDLDMGRTVVGAYRIFPEHDSALVFADNSVLLRKDDQYRMVDFSDFNIDGKDLFQLSRESQEQNTVARNALGEVVSINTPNVNIRKEYVISNADIGVISAKVMEKFNTIPASDIRSQLRATSHPDITPEMISLANLSKLSAAEIIKLELGDTTLPTIEKANEIVRNNKDKLLFSDLSTAVNTNDSLVFADDSELSVGEDGLSVSYAQGRYQELLNNAPSKSLKNDIATPVFNHSLSMAENVAVALRLSENEVTPISIRNVAKQYNGKVSEPIPSVKTLGDVLWDTHEPTLLVKIAETYRDILEPESENRFKYDDGKPLHYILSLVDQFVPEDQEGLHNFNSEIYNQISTDYAKLVQKDYSLPIAYLFEDESVLYTSENKIVSAEKNANWGIKGQPHYKDELNHILANRHQPDIAKLLNEQYKDSTLAALRPTTDTPEQVQQVKSEQVKPDTDTKSDTKAFVIVNKANQGIALGGTRQQVKEMLLSRLDLPQDTDVRQYADEHELKMYAISRLDIDNVVAQTTYLETMSNEAITKIHKAEQRLANVIDDINNKPTAAFMVEQITQSGTFNPLTGKEQVYLPLGADVQKLVDMYAKENNIPAPKAGDRVQLTIDNTAELEDGSTISYYAGIGITSYDNKDERIFAITKTANDYALNILREDYKRVKEASRKTELEQKQRQDNGMKIR